jgi:hypothetical protein|tara:strand:+ start:539 stop:676 length:138 start_codon:yes stop_codon:yes gene_type:complete
MDKEEINKLADEISFRLMATNKHVDHQWLIEVLTKALTPKKDEEV